MIQLCVEDYCQDCPEFKPEALKIQINDFDLNSHIDTIVQCEHKERCEKFIRYLKGKLKETNK